MALARTLRAGALGLALAVGAFSGCGLPDALPELPPPTEPDSSTTSEQFTFKVPTATDEPFLGVEVYYRLSTGDAADEDGIALSELMALGFRRISSETDRYPAPVRPLIAQPRAGATVTLDFSEVDIGADPVATYRDTGGAQRRVSLRRAVHHAADGRYKRFACEEFDGGDGGIGRDADIESVAGQLGGDEACERVQIQLYALSYGGTDRFTVHSVALDLGTIEVTFGRR